MKIGYLSKKSLAIVSLVSFLLVAFIVIGILDTVPSIPSSEPKSTTEQPSSNAVTKEVDTSISNYEINATFNKNTIKGSLRLNYLNTSANNLNEIYFCLYPNAFKDAAKTTANEFMDRAYPNGFSEGSISVSDITVNGKNTTYATEHDDQLLKVTASVKKHKSVIISMNFEVKLPNTPSRMGYFTNTVNLGNWYPIVCVYENGNWNKCIYNPNGDPFYSQVANYSVTLTLPSTYTLATTGIITEKNTKNPLNTVWTVRADKVRDFACVFSQNFKLKSAIYDNIIVYSYYIGDDKYGQKALDTGVNAIKTFNEMFGKYPYDQISIVSCDFYIGGMEYPNMVMINKDLYASNTIDALEEVVAHEVAHQWWYGVVGNDEINKAWLDESLTHYSTMMYYEKTYGDQRFKEAMSSSKSYYCATIQVLKATGVDFNEKIDRPSSSFNDWRLYDVLVYDKGAMMLDSIRGAVGDKKFFDSLKEYYSTNMYKNVTEKELISAFNKKSGIDVTSIMNPWLSGNVVLPAA